MAILGLSAGFHDAAVSVIDSNGNITFAGHSERYSKKKNDPNLNRAILEEAVASTDEFITDIGWYERPWKKHTRQIYSGEKSIFSLPYSPRKMIEEVSGDTFAHIPIHKFDHHMSHAAAGFQTSPFDKAVCVVVDAIGEWDCFSVWVADYHNGSARYKRVKSIKYPNSLGLYYSAITKACGLKPNEEEYITMGMAAYGNPNNWYHCLAYDITEVKKQGGDFDFQVNHNFHTGLPESLNNLSMAPEDIAAAGQRNVESVLLQLFTYVQKVCLYNNTENIVYMGGVALNCVANDVIYYHLNSYKDAGYDLWIMPNPGDAGSSLGAAALIDGKQLNWENAYLGTNIPGEYPVRDIIKELQMSQIVGVANGRAEFGPRALGNRSLLADPRGEDIKDRVNVIKRRQKFRPFAPVILEEYATEYFETEYPEIHRYMQYTVKGTDKCVEECPAILHVDGTARVQTVPKTDKTGIRNLLEQWYFWSGGCPMLLNTSLNIRGEPMVNDRNDAKRFYERYGIKVL